MPDATLTIVRDETGEHIVVTHADEVIWVVPELWAEVSDPARGRVPGDAEIGGDLLTFGTEGEGLGRLTYRRTGETFDYGHRVIVCVRAQPEVGRD